MSLVINDLDSIWTKVLLSMFPLTRQFFKNYCCLSGIDHNVVTIDVFNQPCLAIAKSKHFYLENLFNSVLQHPVKIHFQLRDRIEN